MDPSQPLIPASVAETSVPPLPSGIPPLPLQSTVKSPVLDAKSAAAPDEDGDEVMDAGLMDSDFDDDDEKQVKDRCVAEHKNYDKVKRQLDEIATAGATALETGFADVNKEHKTNYEPCARPEGIHVTHRARFEPIIQKALDAMSKQAVALLRDGAGPDADGGFLDRPLNDDGSCPYGAALLRAMQDDSRGPLHPYYIEDLLHFFADDGTWVAAIPNDIILFALAQLLLPSSDGGERYQKRADPALVNVPDPIGKKAPNASFHFMVLKQLIDTLVNCARPPEAKSLLADKQIPALVSDTLSAMVHNKGTYTLGQYFFFVAIRILCFRDREFLSQLVHSDPDNPSGLMDLLTAASKLKLRCDVVIMPDMPLYMDAEWRFCTKDMTPLDDADEPYEAKHFRCFARNDKDMAAPKPSTKRAARVCPIEDMPTIVERLCEEASGLLQPEKKKKNKSKKKPKKPESERKSDSGKEEKKAKASPKPAAGLHSQCMSLDAHRQLMQTVTTQAAADSLKIKTLTNANRDLNDALTKSEKLASDTASSLQAAKARITELEDAHTADSKSQNALQAQVNTLTEEKADLTQQLQDARKASKRKHSDAEESAPKRQRKADKDQPAMEDEAPKSKPKGKGKGSRKPQPLAANKSRSRGLIGKPDKFVPS